MYEKILVPVDGSATSMRGLQEAIKLAKLSGATLKLVHVVDETSFISSSDGGIALTPELLASIKQAGEQVLTAGSKQVHLAEIPVETTLIESYGGRVCELVLAAVDDWGAQLIVLGTHGRRGVKRMLLGSDAEQILRQAKVPVLLVRGE